MKKTKISEPPITDGTTMENARKWLNIIRYTECGTVIQLQDDCEYRVLEIINNKKILKRLLGKYYRRYLLRYVPIDNRNLLTEVREGLAEICRAKKITSEKNLADLDIAGLLHELAGKGYAVGFFISHITSLIKSGKYQDLIDFEYIIRTSKNFSAVVFSEIDLSDPKYKQLSDKCSFLYDHISKYPLYGKDDCRQFLKHYTEQWNFHPDRKIVNQIIGACGGYLWLIHQALRTIRNEECIVDEALTSEEMILKLETVWNKFTPEEKRVIEKVYFDTFESSLSLTHEYSYLKKIKAIIESDNKPALGIPLLAEILRRELRLKKFRLDRDKILIGERDISSNLSKNEKVFLTLLLNSKKQVVARDTIAASLYGQNWQENYSDWAIDRLSHRLRKKLNRLGIDSKLISTLKKKGFKFG